VRADLSNHIDRHERPPVPNTNHDAGHRRVTLSDRTDDHVVENTDHPSVRVQHARADGARD
jgi:hypothetical protein